MKNIIDSGHASGKWVGMCGEMAADPSFTMVLLGLGLNEFSVSPVQIPKIKKIIRSSSFLEAKALVAEILQSPDNEAIIKKIRMQELKSQTNQA